MGRWYELKPKLMLCVHNDIELDFYLSRESKSSCDGSKEGWYTVTKDYNMISVLKQVLVAANQFKYVKDLEVLNDTTIKYKLVGLPNVTLVLH